MHSIPIEDISSLFTHKRKGFCIRLCLRLPVTVMYTSSKTYYNHIHGRKPCCCDHEVLKLENFTEKIEKLEGMGVIKEGKLYCRRRRSDRDGDHHKKNTKPLHENCSADLSVLNAQDNTAPIPEATGAAAAITEIHREPSNFNEDHQQAWINFVPMLELIPSEPAGDGYFPLSRQHSFLEKSESVRSGCFPTRLY